MQVPVSQEESGDGVAIVTPSDRVPGLDGLRGAALLMVMAAHFSRFGAVPVEAIPDRFFRQVTDGGWFALDIFFVLSGFLITGILLESKGGVKYFRNFYFRRGLRIFPAYYAYILFLFLLFPFVFPSEDAAYSSILHDKFWFLTYAMNIRIGLDHGLRPDLPFSVHLWSMGVEEQFYFVWPFLVLLLKRRQLMVLCALAVVFSVVTRTLMYTSGYHHWISYSFTPARLDCLAIGSFVALAMRDANDFRRILPWLRTLTIVSVPTIIAFSLANGQFDPFDPWGRIISHTLIGFIFASVIIGIITAPQGASISRFFGNRVFTRLGTYSYTMYLWHLLVGYVFFEYFAVWDNIPTIAGSSLPGLFAFMIVAGIPTYLIGWVSWHYFEAPILRLKRYFKYDSAEPEEQKEQLKPPPAGTLAAQPVMEP